MATVFDYAKLYRDKGREAWVRLTNRQRIVFGAIGAAIVLGFAILIASFQIGPGPFVPIQTTVRDVDRSLEILSAWGIEARIDTVRAELLVPKEHERRAMLILNAERQFPSASAAYEFLREGSFTQTDKQRQESTRVALQEVLSGTISNMPFITEAIVQLSPPVEPWRFRLDRSEQSAKASVSLKMRDGGRLEDFQVKAIADLVATAYPTLRSEQVSIVDAENGIPHRYSEALEANIEYWRLKEREENRIARAAENVLSAFGPKAEAYVFVDATTTEERRTQFDDGDQGKETYSEERMMTSEARNRFGTAGIEPGAGRDDIFDPGRGVRDENIMDESRLARREFNRTNIVTRDSTGFRPDQLRSTIAVTLNQNVAGEMTEEELSRLRVHVARATNLPEDNISLVVVPYTDAMMGAGAGTAGGIGAWLTEDNIVKGIMLLLMLGAFIALMVMLKRAAPKPLTLVDDEFVEEEAVPMPDVPRLPPASQLEGNLVKEKVVELVRKNPQAAANLIKRWMILGK